MKSEPINDFYHYELYGGLFLLSHVLMSLYLVYYYVMVAASASVLIAGIASVCSLALIQFLPFTNNPYPKQASEALAWEPGFLGAFKSAMLYLFGGYWLPTKDHLAYLYGNYTHILTSLFMATFFVCLGCLIHGLVFHTALLAPLMPLIEVSIMPFVMFSLLSVLFLESVLVAPLMLLLIFAPVLQTPLIMCLAPVVSFALLYCIESFKALTNITFNQPDPLKPYTLVENMPVPTYLGFKPSLKKGPFLYNKDEDPGLIEENRTVESASNG